MKPHTKLLQQLEGNFSLRVFCYLVLAMVLVAVLFNIFFIRLQIADLKDQTIKTGQYLTATLAYSVRLGIFAEDENEIEKAVNAAFQVREVRTVCALNLKNEILHKARSTNDKTQSDGLPEERHNLELLNRIKADGQVRHLEHDDVLEFWAPVYSTGEKFTPASMYFDSNESEQKKGKNLIGFLGITMDKHLLNEAIRVVVRKNLLFFVFFLVLGSVVTFFIVRAVTRPLDKLIGSIQGLGIQVPSRDQFGVLAHTFDTMVKQLGEAFATINSLKEGLENKVQELEQEVSRHRQTEVELVKSEKKHRSLVETIRDVVYTTDADGLVTYVSPIIENLSGYTPSHMIGRKFSDCIQPVQLPEAGERFAGGRKQPDPESSIGICTTKNNRSLYFEIKSVPLPDASGRPDGRIGVARDITQRIEAETRRRDLEIKALTQSKLASLGQIATGIAHEVNQPLSFIKIIFEATLRDIEDGDLDLAEMAADFKKSLHQIDRITSITNHLRTFGHMDSVSVANVSLPEILDNALILLGERLHLKNIAIERDIAEDLPQVHGNANKLEQIFINLFQNSMDALADRKDGVVRIEMCREANEVRIRFADNGPGIPPEHQGKIFEPFFTTKKAGQGTGLGLAIVYGIINEHHGCIAYETGDERGAIFTITLPAAQL